MADSLYPKGIESIMDGTVDLLTTPIVAHLVDALYTFNASDQFVSDLGMGELSGTGYARKVLTGKNVTSTTSPVRGIFGAADITWAGINAGTATALVLSADVGLDSVCPLIAYIDSGGFPITTNGGDLAVSWASGKIFYL